MTLGIKKNYNVIHHHSKSIQPLLTTVTITQNQPNHHHNDPQIIIQNCTAQPQSKIDHSWHATSTTHQLRALATTPKSNQIVRLMTIKPTATNSRERE